MTDDLRRQQGNGPARDSEASSPKRRRGRGVIVFLILAVFTLNQIRDSTVSLHVVGSPRQATATSGTAAPTSASAQASVAQREAAVYSALVRYEIAQLTATAQSPPGSMYFVQNQIFALAPTATATNPNRFTALSQEGPVLTAVQEGIINELAPTPLRFVPDPQVVSLPCVAPGHNYVFTGTGGGGHEALYALADTGTAWTVTGPVGIEQNSLGLCG